MSNIKEVLDGIQASGEHGLFCLQEALLAQDDLQADVSAAGPARFGLRDAKAIQPGLQLEGSGLVSLPLTLAEADELLTMRLSSFTHHVFEQG